MKIFLSGLKAMLPIVPGIIPFGTVMGSVFAEAKLDLFHSLSMNFMVFAGASQLATVDLMTKKAAIITAVLTGLIINLRFILYSAALSPVIHKSSIWVKLGFAYCLTDQSYAVVTANQQKFSSNQELITFYFGASTCMIFAWQLSVLTGFLLGSVAPESWALNFAIPLSFVALTIPSIKNKKFLAIAIFSSALSLLLYSMPYNLGLITTALLSIGFGILISKKEVKT